MDASEPNSHSTNSLKKPSVFSFSTSYFFCIYLGLFFLFVFGSMEPLSASRFERYLLLGLLCGALIFFAATGQPGAKWRLLPIDVLVCCWGCWNCYTLSHAEIPFASLEGARLIVVALASYLAGALISKRNRRMFLGFFALAALVIAAMGFFQFQFLLSPLLTAALLALFIFCAWSIPAERVWQPFRQFLFKSKITVMLLILVGCAIFWKYSGWNQIDSFGASTTIVNADEIARDIFRDHLIFGAGPGNFAWHGYARTGDIDFLKPQNWGTPWPYLASLGGVSSLLYILLLFHSMFFMNLIPRRLRSITSPVNLCLRAVLFVWLILGFIEGFLFSTLGFFITFGMIGILRGIKNEWLQRDLATLETCKKNKVIESIDYQPSAPKKARHWTAKVGWFALGIMVTILATAVLTFPEICYHLFRTKNYSQVASSLYSVHPQGAKTKFRNLINEKPTTNLELTGNNFSKLANELISKNRFDPDSYSLIVTAAQKMDQDQNEIVRLLEQGFSNCPGSVHLGKLLCRELEKLDETEKALAFISTLTTKHPKDYELQIMYHRLLQREAHYDQAQKIAKRIEQLRY